MAINATKLMIDECFIKKVQKLIKNKIIFCSY